MVATERAQRPTRLPLMVESVAVERVDMQPAPGHSPELTALVAVAVPEVASVVLLASRLLRQAEVDLAVRGR